MSAEVGDTVYRLNAGDSKGSTIHADPDCPKLNSSQQGREPVEKPADAFPDWYPRCSVCWPGEADDGL